MKGARLRPRVVPASKMEARALHDFQATEPDELSFTKGSILKVLVC